MSSRGNLIVISAASGSGKTSLAHRVLREMPGLRFSVSHTTRKSRIGEKDGVDYFFVSKEKFEDMIREDAFLEHAHVYGNYYGTSSRFVESELAAGHDVLLDIDVQGAMAVKKRMPEAITVFVFAPSYQVLSDRLRKRGLDDDEVIRGRLQIASGEIRCYREYEYVIINDDIEKSVLELKSIVLAARCRLDRRRERAEEIIRTFPEISGR